MQPKKSVLALIKQWNEKRDKLKIVEIHGLSGLNTTDVRALAAAFNNLPLVEEIILHEQFTSPHIAEEFMKSIPTVKRIRCGETVVLLNQSEIVSSSSQSLADNQPSDPVVIVDAPKSSGIQYTQAALPTSFKSVNYVRIYRSLNRTIDDTIRADYRDLNSNAWCRDTYRPLPRADEKVASEKDWVERIKSAEQPKLARRFISMKSKCDDLVAYMIDQSLELPRNYHLLSEWENYVLNQLREAPGYTHTDKLPACKPDAEWNQYINQFLSEPHLLKQSEEASITPSTAHNPASIASRKKVRPKSSKKQGPAIYSNLDTKINEINRRGYPFLNKHAWNHDTYRPLPRANEKVASEEEWEGRIKSAEQPRLAQRFISMKSKCDSLVAYMIDQSLELPHNYHLLAEWENYVLKQLREAPGYTHKDKLPACKPDVEWNDYVDKFLKNPHLLELNVETSATSKASSATPSSTTNTYAAIVNQIGLATSSMEASSDPAPGSKRPRSEDNNSHEQAEEATKRQRTSTIEGSHERAEQPEKTTVSHHTPAGLTPRR